MKMIELGHIQEQFAGLIWDHEPISSGELVKLCEKELNWKKATTYTVLHNLCDKGLFKNEKSIVTSVISRDEFYAASFERILESSYKGSLPAFLAAFTSHKKLTPEEAEEIRQMISDSVKEG
ncbi:MAG: BlaI/MecI/CopY family transcriptional regulator [Lachnospiraceae bacterium]|nr:BlaI/MecI/CopY family transcriptional regulator [Lachnospiraceae bacterium]